MTTFVVQAEPGKMKHTFTGFKPVFANVHVHLIMLEQIKPLREEIMRRTEVASEAGWLEALRTKVLEGLEATAMAVRQYTAQDSISPDITLEERRTLRDSFKSEALDKSVTFEQLARSREATHTDQQLHPSQIHPFSVTFDYEGLTNLDWAQPTPDRVQHSQLRLVVIALDSLMVTMSNSHSSDLARGVLSDESAIWLSDLADIYNIADSARYIPQPFYPTGESLNERETRFNADGTSDPAINAGDASGEVAGVNRTTRTGAAAPRS